MKIKLLLIPLVFVLLLNSVNSLEIYTKKCFKDGHIEIVVNGGDNESKVYTDDIKVKIDGTEINKNWSNEYVYDSLSAEKQYSSLNTDEGMFNVKGIYFISLDYAITLRNGDKDWKSIQETVECPGLLFTCHNLGISIDSCYTKDGKFQAYLNIKGLEQSQGVVMDAKEVVTYRLEAKEDYFDIRNATGKKGELPLNAELKKISKDRYLFESEFKDNFVKTLLLRYNDKLLFPCPQGDYPNISFYDYKQCTLETAKEEIEKIELKEESNIEPKESVEKEIEKQETKEIQEPNIKKDYSQLKIMGLLIIVVLLISGIILFYLKKRGYI